MSAASPTTHTPSPDEVRWFARRVADQMSGAVTAAMIHLGDRLGLYAALHEIGEPCTAAALAARCGLVERWVREWAANQAAAGLLVLEAGPGDEPGDERFALAPAAVPVLVDRDDESHLAGLFHQLPQTMARLVDLPKSFRTGLGRDYDDLGPEAAEGIERNFEPWMRRHLVDDVLPLVDGVTERLAAGAAAADVGCGTGGAVLCLARAFPAARVTGYDISRHALDRARRRLADSGLTNATFHDPRTRPLPEDGSLALVTTIGCLHDMTDPASVVRSIRRALADDGAWLIVDIKAHETLAANIERNPMAAMMYGTSVLTCLPSGLSEPGGAGLGTLGLTPRRAEEMARAAGFTRFRRLDVDHPVDAFYEVRP